MKVIFLDVDGVLNSDEYFDKIRNKKTTDIEREIDINKVIELKKAVDETGASVVLSSSWRYSSKLFNNLKQLFMNYNIVLGNTPLMRKDRGIEIKKWLEEHPDTEDYVILDDEIFKSFDDVLLKHLIKIGTADGIQFGEGLQEKDIQEIVLRFGRKTEKENKEKER